MTATGGQQVIFQASGDEEQIEGAQVLHIDPEQLAAALAQSGDGTAQIVDADGNTITLTAEQLAAAGLIQIVSSSEQTESGGTAGDGGDQAYFVVGQDEQHAEPTKGSKSPRRVPPASPPVQQHGAAPAHRVTRSSASSSGAPSAPATTTSTGEMDIDAIRDPNDLKAALEKMKRTLEEKDKTLAEMDSKLKESSEQNVIMAHALVNTCRSDEVEVVVQNPDGTPGKRQIVSIKQAGAAAAALAPHGYGAGGRTRGSYVYPSSSVAAAAGPQGPTAIARADLLPFQCEQCPKRFAADHHLRRHVEMSHAKRRPFFCRFCNRDLFFTGEQLFQAHLRIHHRGEADYAQPEDEGAADEGEENEPPPKRRSVSFAPTTAGTRTTAQSTPVTRRSARLAATASEEEEAEETVEPEVEPAWEGEPAIETTPTPPAGAKEGDYSFFKCKACDREFLSMQGFRRHCTTSHPGMEVETTAKMQKESPLKEHQSAAKSAEEGVEHKCDECGRQFNRGENLEKHRVAHMPEAFPFLCHLCPKRFKWRENLQAHLIWHQQHMPFKCATCTKAGCCEPS